MYGNDRGRGGGRGRGRGRGRGGGRGFYSNSQSNYSNSNSNYNRASTAASLDNDSQSNQPIDWGKLNEQFDEQERQYLASLPKINKDLYFEDPEVTNLTQAEVEKIRQENFDIKVSNIQKEGEDENLDIINNPVLTFEHAFSRYPDILEVVKSKGFKEPTPIQKQAWPLLMSGRDMVGIAQTGTGKTLAFLLPGLVHIQAQMHSRDNDREPLMLVLAPTRELAQQIHTEILKFQIPGIRSVCVYGQGKTSEQISALEEGVEIIVATPGRLMDLQKKEHTSLKKVTYFVLDEADRMLDLGFQPDIMKIHYTMRSDRQVAMTSATWLSDIQYVANRLMHKPVKVHIGDLNLAAVHTIKQEIIVCESDDKEYHFEEYMKNREEDDKIIIFVNRKALTPIINMKLFDMGIMDSDVMCGDIPQDSRERALEDFRNGSIKILIATDLASRGLDVQNVTKVLNYDVPNNMEEYVHRCGRTGRAEKSGQVTTFFTWNDRRKANELLEILKRGNDEIPKALLDLSERHARSVQNRERGGGGDGFRGGRGGRGGRRGRSSFNYY